MDYTIVTITFFSLTLFFFVSISSASQNCSPTYCYQNETIIQYPFWITGAHSESCGYPSFNVSCDRAKRTTTLNIPYSGEFNVESIDYVNKNIVVSDPNNCLAKKLFSLDLSTSPFLIGKYQSYTFFNCSNVAPEYKEYVISCLSGSNYTVAATNSEYLIKDFSKVCKVIKEVKYPIYASHMTTPYGNDMVLIWDTPYCLNCEGTCRFKNSFSLDSVCFDIPNKGLKKASLVAAIIGIIIAMALGVFGLPCYLSYRLTRAALEIMTDEVAGVATTTVNIVTVTRGIDTQTLNSYPKVVLGESCRIPNPGDDTCSICMSEYKPKDTIKSIPECNHCFHVDCIDEWLHLNTSCPICRISPLQNTLL